jgi:DNA processing protein
MEATTIRAYLRLYHSRGLSLLQFSRLLKQAGTISGLLAQSGERLQAAGLNRGQLALLQSTATTASVEAKIERDLVWLQSPGNTLVGYESSSYPPLLRQTDFPPPLLYVVGNDSLLTASQLSIVGSRKASEYGCRNAYWMAHELSHAGLLICSGMAKGIDTQAHTGALAATNATVAVVGTGIDVCYPLCNAQLAAEIGNNGVLISELPLGTPPRAENFPQRNRIISGMGLGTLVVEATLRSGSLITARLALEENREVFAFPGSISSQSCRGCHRLIKEGAKLVEEPEDILEELGLSNSNENTDEGVSSSRPGDADQEHHGLNRDERRLVRLIGSDHCLMQSLLESTGLSFQQLNAQLLHLEMLGIIRAQGGRFSCIDPAR